MRKLILFLFVVAFFSSCSDDKTPEVKEVITMEDVKKQNNSDNPSADDIRNKYKKPTEEQKAADYAAEEAEEQANVPVDDMVNYNDTKNSDGYLNIMMKDTKTPLPIRPILVKQTKTRLELIGTGYRYPYEIISSTVKQATSILQEHTLKVKSIDTPMPLEINHYTLRTLTRINTRKVVGLRFDGGESFFSSEFIKELEKYDMNLRGAEPFVDDAKDDKYDNIIKVPVPPSSQKRTVKNSNKHYFEYYVESGDNLKYLADLYGTTVQDIVNMNPFLKYRNNLGIRIGEKLRIPSE